MYMTSERIAEIRTKYGAAESSRHNREQSIVRMVVNRILRMGYTLRVDDGEEMHPETDSFDAAWDVLGETDMDRIYVFDKEPDNGAPRQVGWVLLVWGNDEDIISDWGWVVQGGKSSEEAMNAICDSELQDADKVDVIRRIVKDVANTYFAEGKMSIGTTVGTLNSLEDHSLITLYEALKSV